MDGSVIERASDRLRVVSEALVAIECRIGGREASLDEAVSEVVLRLGGQTGSIWLFGNGGSGAIADHIACDMMLLGWRAFALTNPAMTTTMANDRGFERAFSGQLDKLAQRGDSCIAMSCSGDSPNVLMALAVLPRPSFKVVLSGFQRVNFLNHERVAADVSFWVPSMSYGVVQIAHLAILHAVVDLARTGT